MRHLVFLPFVATLAGCLASPLEPCTDNVQCRDAFGFGYVCGDGGYCAQADVPERCTSTYPDDLFADPASYKDAIVLGGTYDATLDIAENNSVRLAVKQADDNQGLDNRQYGYVMCSYEDDLDDGLSQEDAVATVGKFLAEDLGVPAIVGPYTSGNAQALFNAVSGDGTLIISPAATSPALTPLDNPNPTDDDPGLLWRTAPPDSLQGKVAAEDMLHRSEHGGDADLTSVAVIYSNDPYGQGLAQFFQDDFESGGGTVFKSYVFENGDQLAAAIAEVQNADLADVQEVFFISGETTDITTFLNAAASKGFTDRGVFLSDAAYDIDIFTGLSGAASLIPKIRGTAPNFDHGTVYDAFANAYQAEYSPSTADDSVYTAFAYDAGWLTIYGTAWSLYQEGDVTGVGIAKGLRHVSSGTEVNVGPLSWNTVKSSFKNGTAIDVVGTSGQLDYDPATEETTAPINVWHIVNGDEFENLYTVSD